MNQQLLQLLDSTQSFFIDVASRAQLHRSFHTTNPHVRYDKKRWIIVLKNNLISSGNILKQVSFSETVNTYILQQHSVCAALQAWFVTRLWNIGGEKVKWNLSFKICWSSLLCLSFFWKRGCWWNALLYITLNQGLNPTNLCFTSLLKRKPVYLSLFQYS